MSSQMTAVELNKMRVADVPDPRTPAERKKARRKIAKAKRKRSKDISMRVAANRDRKLAIATVAVIGLILLGMIFVSAYCANVKHDINVVNKEILAIQEDIDYLKVEIESGNNLATIEKKAIKELGMVYPTADQFRYLDRTKSAKKEDMAQVIKENAYETW